MTSLSVMAVVALCMIHAGAGAAFAAKVKLPFVFNGKGAGIESTTSCDGTAVLGTRCDGSTNCSCYEATGLGKGTVVGAVSFDNKTLVLFSPADPLDGCSYVAGLLTLTSPNGKNILALDYLGQECVGPNSFIINATWSADNANSQGKFATTNGGGTLIGKKTHLGTSSAT